MTHHQQPGHSDHKTYRLNLQLQILYENPLKFFFANVNTSYNNPMD